MSLSIGGMSRSKRGSYSAGGVNNSNSIPVLGITIPIPTSNGGGIKGYMAQQLVDVDKTYIDYEQPRFNLREAWNTTYPSQLKAANVGSRCTPFRAVNNAGDILSRKNYSSGGPCQTFQYRPNVYGLRKNFGGIRHEPDATGIPSAACNVKYVYDSSDYIKYKKQSAMAKTYNQITNGGNDSNGSQVAYKAIRRY